MCTHLLPAWTRPPFILLLAALAPSATAQDLVVSRIGDAGNEFVHWGESGGVHAYSFATTACNVGSLPIDWGPANSSNHPVIGQNFFRIADGRIEQLGQSWLKHGFCALNEPTCGTCQVTPCSTLGIGCADTYGGALNDGQFGGPKSDVSPARGAHSDPPMLPTGGDPVLRGRLQVLDSEWAQPGETYIAEAQYVSQHDHEAGNARNNASWIEIDVDPSDDSVAVAGNIAIGDPAIYAWKQFDPTVEIDEVVVRAEGGPLAHGYLFLGCKVTDVGGGQWRYEYALQNLTSTRAAGSFSIPLGCSDDITIGSLFFRDVDYHSGEIYDGSDWTASVAGGWLTWETTTPYSVDPNGNALRWGTLYDFGFTADRAPVDSRARIGLFAPGVPAAVFGSVQAPCPPFACGSATRYCSPASPNSSGGSAELEFTGSLNVDDNNIALRASSLPANQIGYFLAGTGSGVVMPPSAQGPYCLSGAPLLRLQPPVLQSGATGSFERSFDVTTLPAGPGQTLNFQAWFRDQNPGSTSNFTDAISLSFCP